MSTSNPSSDPHRDSQASGAPADETTGGAPARRRRRATAAATTPTRVPAAEQPVLAAPDGSRGDGGDEDPSRAVRPEDGGAGATEPAQEDVVEDARADEAADVDADGARADDAEGAADAGADEAPRDGAAQAGGPGAQAPYLPAASLLFQAPDPARAR
ncbi:ribonuclease E/G, partial [Actinomyces israelii]|nr:ribonuclease E/G [Actinomyces israelii]